MEPLTGTDPVISEYQSDVFPVRTTKAIKSISCGARPQNRTVIRCLQGNCNAIIPAGRNCGASCGSRNHIYALEARHNSRYTKDALKLAEARGADPQTVFAVPAAFKAEPFAGMDALPIIIYPSSVETNIFGLTVFRPISPYSRWITMLFISCIDRYPEL